MNILTAEQIRAWDQYTMEHEPIASIDLMERAAAACTFWIVSKFTHQKSFLIFCGPGNNGGDGLAMARQLSKSGYPVSVFYLHSEKYSDDFNCNLKRLQKETLVPVKRIENDSEFPLIESTQLVIDALFGYGLNRPLCGMEASLVEHLNAARSTIISIDLPSGLFADNSSLGNQVIQASHTLSFQCYKQALLIQENAPFIGTVHILDIALHEGFLNEINNTQHFLTEDDIRKIFRPRDAFAHKGHFGHALLVAGSYGKMGAAILAARACIHSGSGLLTCLTPKCGYGVMQLAVPEAMVMTDENEKVLSLLPDDVERFDAIGIGPGIGTADETVHLLSFLARRYSKPLVMDADGLNIISRNPVFLSQLPQNSILTPHPKEFDRLFGEHSNDFDRVKTARLKAAELKIVIVLKGHHSFIAAPGKRSYFNSTGNAGMAKGGSGDVLTGILTALLAQGYPPLEAAMLGVYLHGNAGDFAARECSMEAMTPSDLIRHLSRSFLEFYSTDISR